MSAATCRMGGPPCRSLCFWILSMRATSHQLHIKSCANCPLVALDALPACHEAGVARRLKCAPHCVSDVTGGFFWGRMKLPRGPQCSQ